MTHPTTTAIATTQPQRACIPDDWRAIAARPDRAWLLDARGAAHAVIVVDTIGDNVEIAELSPTAIVARRVPYAALGRAVITEVAVSPQPGAPADPAILARPGFPVTGEGAWLHVGRDGTDATDATNTTTLDGFVPASAVGTIWTPAPTPARNHFRIWWSSLRDAPDGRLLAANLAGIAAIIVLGGGDASWVHVRAITARAIVEGWTPPPPPLPPSPPHAGRYDFSSDELDAPIADDGLTGSCLYDAPSGRVIGLVLASTGKAPSPARAAPGWIELTIATPSAPINVYAPAPPPPPPEEPPIDWRFDSQWRDR